MKNIRFLTFVLILGSLLLSACGAGPATPTSAPNVAASTKVDAMPVAFVGVIESITGNQWIISGTTVTVDESVVRDGPFGIGDQVKVEGHVGPNGSFTVLRVEAPTLSNDNSNDANSNDDNSNDSNSNDDNSNDSNSNDDNSNDDNSNDDNGGNSNDDDGSNSNDDDGSNSNDDNSNDDNGGNSNDDDSNDDNGGNSNDDDGNDDNSGKGRGGDDDKGDDNKGDNSNDD